MIETMMIDSTLQRIGEIGVIPVIRAANVDEALRAVDAIYAGGIPIVEITMTIPDAPRALARVLRQYGDTIVAGAGTVLTTDDAMRCLDVGANFLVSPGLSIAVMAVARDLKVLAIPGALTPTEIMNALIVGARAIKVFPCSSAGGARHLKALLGPFPKVALIPTGGVNSSNAAEYIAAGAFALGAGGDLIDSESLTSGDTSKITRAAKDLVAAVRTARESCQIS